MESGFYYETYWGWANRYYLHWTKSKRLEFLGDHPSRQAKPEGLPSKKLDINKLTMSNLKKIIYNCKQATFLIEKKAIEKLSFREAVQLRIHLLGCSFCRLYKKQSRVINEMVHELFRTSMHSGYKLHDDFKKELRERIEDELNKNWWTRIRPNGIEYAHEFV